MYKEDPLQKTEDLSFSPSISYFYDISEVRKCSVHQFNEWHPISVAQVRTPPCLTISMPLVHCPILFCLTIKYIPNQSPSLRLCFLCCNPHLHYFSLEWASHPVSPHPLWILTNIFFIQHPKMFAQCTVIHCYPHEQLSVVFFCSSEKRAKHPMCRTSKTYLNPLTAPHPLYLLVFS